MKRFALIALLLFVSAFSNADSIKLTSGSGQINANAAPGFNFQFHGSGYDLFPMDLDSYAGTLARIIREDIANAQSLVRSGL